MRVIQRIVNWWFPRSRIYIAESNLRDCVAANKRLAKELWAKEQELRKLKGTCT